VQPAGKIVSIGFAHVGKQQVAAMQVVRMNPDGSLDTAFNGTGIATINFGTGILDATAVALQPDGKILVGGRGNSGNPRVGLQDIVARLNGTGTLAGTLDTTFGNTAKKGVGGGIWAANGVSY